MFAIIFPLHNPFQEVKLKIRHSIGVNKPMCKLLYMKYGTGSDELSSDLLSQSVTFRHFRDEFRDLHSHVIDACKTTSLKKLNQGRE